MDFTKMQSAGNDYVLVEANNKQSDWPRLAVAVCERHLGVGADSLLLLMPSEKADFKMRIFDADGSEAETCGNGIRCLAKYVFEKRLISHNADEILVETIAGIRKVKLEKDSPAVTEKDEMNRLEWKTTLSKKAKQTIRYDFSVEYPRDMQIQGLP